MLETRLWQAALSVALLVGSSGCRPAPERSEPRAPDEDAARVRTMTDRDILANNAFFYYDDLDAAWRFYTEIMGLETVVDYGFAKILRVAQTSYLTLVDAESGMHSTDEPKTVAIALVTDQLDGWYEHLKAQNVKWRSEYAPTPRDDGRPHHGFVVYDPEGYTLEIERFNPDRENERLVPRLAELKSFHPAEGLETRRPKELGVKATILWMYYKDVAAMERFYEEVMGFELMVDEGWAKIYPTSRSGFIGLVDGAKGMHSWTEKKAVTVSFFTDDVDAWFAYLEAQPRFELRTKQIFVESDKVRVIVGYDPEGYFLELDTFLDEPGNEELLRQLAESSP